MHAPAESDAHSRDTQLPQTPHVDPPELKGQVALLEERVRMLENVISRVLLPALPPAGSIISFSSTSTPTTTSTWLPLDGAAAIERWYDAAEAEELVSRAQALGGDQSGLLGAIQGRACVRAAAHTSGGPTSRLIKITRRPSTVLTTHEGGTHGHADT